MAGRVEDGVTGYRLHAESAGVGAEEDVGAGKARLCGGMGRQRREHGRRILSRVLWVDHGALNIVHNFQFVKGSTAQGPVEVC